ncbi:TPA: type II toxin-antitoxin system mRNA interferase toxin, RelE/StbE family [Patescibacteria group bacterium]|nr:type II toxin-antitoxin system mRNA interferase toxin, RelE/StbE family [Patescibacteria group bacterium]
MIDRIVLHPKFTRSYRKRIAPDKQLSLRTRQRIELFKHNPSHPILRNHPLQGEKGGFRSFSITGDVRIIYKIEGTIATFFDIGTHNQVY